MTTGSLISSNYTLEFSTFSLGATDFLGNGPIILDELVLVLDLLYPVDSRIISSF